MKISKSELIKAIKLKCKEDCCCGDIGNVKECAVKSCPLLNIKNIFFNGENHIDTPKSKTGVRTLSPEHLAKLAVGRELAKLAKAGA